MRFLFDRSSEQPFPQGGMSEGRPGCRYGGGLLSFCL